MSKRKDQERAKLGLIFRDGKLVNREEYMIAHPTRQQIADKLKQERKTLFSSRVPVEPYYCGKCNRMHKSGKIFIEHFQYAGIAT